MVILKSYVFCSGLFEFCLSLYFDFTWKRSNGRSIWVIYWFFFPLLVVPRLHSLILYIQGGPKRIQRFWSEISMTFVIEYHWFCCIGYNILFQVIWHQVHQVWIKRFDSRAIFLRQCHFQNVLLLRPAKQASSSAIFSSDGVPLNQLCDKSIIALT